MPWSVWAVLFVFCEGAYAWSSEPDCVTADGSVGYCTALSDCRSLRRGVTPVLCRYSRGYGTRICCPRSSSRYTYTSNQQGDVFDETPIAFPTESTYNGFNSHYQPTTPSYNRPRPTYNGNSNYRPYSPEPSHHNRPQYHEKPSYSSESYEDEDRPFTFQGNTRPSYEHSRPETDRPWRGSGSSSGYRPDRTTPQPTWAVENEKETGFSSRKRTSALKCDEYARLVSQTIGVLPLSLNAEAVPLKVQQCDFSAVKLIVGGEASELGEFPHMAAIGFWSAGTHKMLWNCGGTLISERFVMTAAHCTNTSYGNPVVVRLGEYNLARDDDGANPVDVDVRRVIVHPDYVKSRKYNDIALIELSQPIRLTRRIRPACLPSDNSIRGKPMATGWGRTDFVGQLSDILMKVSLNVVNNQLCNTFYKTNSPGAASFPSGIVDTMLCAGELEGGRDTCLGDSGGPLSVTNKENPCIHYVIGITSFGKICGAPNSPGVYTRVSRYVPWIEQVVW